MSSDEDFPPGTLRNVFFAGQSHHARRVASSEDVSEFLHPVSVSRLPSFRTQPLENLKPLPMNKWVPEPPSPWRKSSKRESCYGDRVYYTHGLASEGGSSGNEELRDKHIHTCHILPPSEIPWRLFLAVLQAQKGNVYFTLLAGRVEYGNYEISSYRCNG